VRRSLFLLACVCVVPGNASLPLHPASIEPNDNRQPAGELRDGVLTLALVAAPGAWRPEAERGLAREAYAFGVEGAGLSIPGPLIRVPAGAEVRVAVRNAISGATLIVHGLHERGSEPRPLEVPDGERRVASFRATSPGTYHYWATTTGAQLIQQRHGAETQLVGAFIVEAPGERRDDHVYVISVEEGPESVPASRPLFAAVVNGRSWPHTTAGRATVGDTVRMRWINASGRPHPMHLHGFYFQVRSRGTPARDTLYDPSQTRLAATELMTAGGTMTFDWVPDRPGNWLVHCHMVAHISPGLRSGAGGHADHRKIANHALDGMAGLVVAWRIEPRAATPDAVEAPRRRVRLIADEVPGLYGEQPGMGFILSGDRLAQLPDTVTIPGPPLVLARGEPVEIAVVNQLAEPTSIHWHAMELESFYDGVSGWSGYGTRVSPHVAPGDSFLVRFTPPRAGTFIYHTHFNEEIQLESGMYGPLIVLEPGARLDPELDRTWIISQTGPAVGGTAPVALNGSVAPHLELTAGRTYRIRLINIHVNQPLIFELTDEAPVVWRALAKDGADLPPHQATPRAARQPIGVGETYDFELAPAAPGPLRISARNLVGRVRLEGTVRVRPPD